MVALSWCLFRLAREILAQTLTSLGTGADCARWEIRGGTRPSPPHQIPDSRFGDGPWVAYHPKNLEHIEQCKAAWGPEEITTRSRQAESEANHADPLAI